MTTQVSPTELSIVIPTYNERENVGELVRRIGRVLDGIAWELIFVDDNSPDGTADQVRGLARTDGRVRLISRHNRRGLASAVVEGALAASAEIVAVMDGDLQHDEAVLPAMFQTVAKDEADIVSASRFLSENGADGLSSEQRVQISNTGIRLANKLFGLDMTDPLTGFFVLRRDVIKRALPELSELGFKILLDLVASSPGPLRVREVPFQFRSRVHGESKLDNRVMYDFLLFFIEKKISRFLPLPARFISFSLINSVGILVHLAVLVPLVSLFGTAFAMAQLTATLVAMGFNYSVNNLVTYHDRQLTGANFYIGFVVFAGLCSLGVIGNVGIASVIHRQYGDMVYLAPAMAGALITVVWNYVATQAFVWGRTRFPGFALRRRRVSAQV